MNATDILSKAAQHMADRAATYDKPEGERSMGRAVEAFNAIAGRDLSESEGWLLLQVLKSVRLFARPGYHADSAEDGVAYAALVAEAMHGAAMSRIPESIRNHCGDFNNLVDELKTAGEWPTEDRIDVIGSNGPTGEHYDDEWKDAPKWANWRAQNSDGEWNYFEREPKQGQGYWENDGGMGTVRRDGKGYNADWRLTLKKRPI